jgi:hypothetical protein
MGGWYRFPSADDREGSAIGTTVEGTAGFAVVAAAAGEDTDACAATDPRSDRGGGA